MKTFFLIFLPPPSLPRNKKRNSLLNKDLLFNLPIYFKRWKTFFINFRFCFLMVNKKIFLQMCARVCQALAYYQFLIYIKNIYCIIFSYFKYILNKHYLLFRFIIYNSDKYYYNSEINYNSFYNLISKKTHILKTSSVLN